MERVTQFEKNPDDGSLFLPQDYPHQGDNHRLRYG